MSIVLGNLTWSPSEIQKDIPLDSGQPGNSALQRVVNALNRSYLDCDNYIFAFPRTETFPPNPDVVINGNLTVTVFKFRAHNPLGLINLRLIVNGSYAGGTGATVNLLENGFPIGTINLPAVAGTQTVLAPVISLGDVTYEIEIVTQLLSVATVRAIWVSWGDLT